MRWWPFGRSVDREQRSAIEQRSLENPMVSTGSTAEELMAFFGVVGGTAALPPVTIETALEVPGIFCAVSFLSRSLAVLPLHVMRRIDSSKVNGELQRLLNEAPNPEMTSFEWRRYTFQQMLTGGRGVSWIERQGSKIVAIWPMDPTKTTVRRRSGRKIYRFDNKEYPAADVIDIPFALKPNLLDAYSPVHKCRKAIALSIAMGDFASTFFAGGGVPPYALEGPMPQGTDAFKRAQKDIDRAIQNSRRTGLPFFGMPPGHSLKAIGIDPAKGQMTEARRYQLEEMSRVYQLPPVFLHDLTHGSFSNTEQQDLQLSKHCISHHASAFEQELNLKLFGWKSGSRYVEHNLDGLQRGDFKSRIEGLARAIQTGQITPDEARALENRPPDPSGHGAKLHIQGATVPLGSQPLKPTPKIEEDGDDDAEAKRAA